MRRAQSRFALLTRLALVLPFLALSLLPQGFMPQRDAAGGMVLVLCTPDGPVELTVDLSTGQPHKKAGNSPCDWSVAQAAPLMPQAASLPLPPQTTLPALAATETDLWRPAHDPRGIWARGPPSLT